MKPIYVMLRVLTHLNMGAALAFLIFLVTLGIRNVSAEALNDSLLPSPATLQSIVVTASRADTKLNEMTQNTSIISPEDIQNAPYRTIDQILKNQAGILLNDQPFYEKDPTGQSINIRGLGNARALVLIDGVPALDAMYGTVQWSLVPLSSIRDVEIIRGGASSLYGNYGMGGVINITTKPISVNDGTVEASYGTFNTCSGSIYKDYAVSDSVKLRFSADNFNTRGYLNQQTFSYPQGVQWKKGNFAEWANNNNLRVQSEIDLGEGISSYFRAGHHTMENAPTGGLVGLKKVTEEYTLSGGVKVPLSSNRKIEANTYYENTRLDQQNGSLFSPTPANPPFSFQTADFKNPYSMAGASMQFTDNSPNLLTDFWAIGADARQQMANNSATNYSSSGASVGTVYASGQQQFFGAFIQGSKLIPWLPLTINASARLDRYQSQIPSFQATSTTGVTTTQIVPDVNQMKFDPTIGVLYKVNEETNFRASAYQAFHAPGLNNLIRGFGSSLGTNSFSDVSANLSNALKWSFPNPTLTPETMKGFEAGFDWREDGNYVQVTGFHALIKNAIVSVNASATQLATLCGGGYNASLHTNACTGPSDGSSASTVLSNSQTILSYGAELQAHYDISNHWSVDGSMTHTNTMFTWIGPDVSATANPLNHQLAGVPRNMGFIGVTFQPNDQWTYNADVRIVGQSWTSTTNSAASRLPAYAVVDVKAQYMWTPKTKTYVSITNLGDLHYVTYNTSTGVVGEPFVIIGGIQHSF